MTDASVPWVQIKCLDGQPCSKDITLWYAPRATEGKAPCVFHISHGRNGPGQLLHFVSTTPGSPQTRTCAWTHEHLIVALITRLNALQDLKPLKMRKAALDSLLDAMTYLMAPEDARITGGSDEMRAAINGAHQALNEAGVTGSLNMPLVERIHAQTRENAALREQVKGLEAALRRERDERITAVHYAVEIADHAESCGIVRTPAFDLAEQRVRTIRAQDTPIPALVAERDKALKRVEELEAVAASAAALLETHHKGSDSTGRTIGQDLSNLRKALKNKTESEG
jgi:hypothetical protein